MKLVLAALVACAATGLTTAHGQTTSELRAAPARFASPDRAARLATAFPEIDRIFTDYAAGAHVPGIAWGVIVDGALVHRGVAGLRDVGARAPVTSDTVFRIASMTKSFTALAILKLRDEGRLSLDDPAERYVPELADLPYPSADAPRVTIRHLLTHAAGFPEDNPWGDRQLAISEAQMTALLRRGIPFANVPGVAYEYSNFGFALLGRIVSVVAGTPYRTYVQREILGPLGMRSTTLEPADVPADRLARGYRWEDGQWRLAPPRADGAFGAMGGMLTSMDDLGRYVGYLMSAWPPRDEAEHGPVRRASLREMQQAWRARPATVTMSATGPQLAVSAYGYGLRISQTCEFAHVVGHAGGLPGYGSLMLWLPEHGVGLIAAGNLTYTSWGPRFDQAFAALARTGALEPRVAQPAPALSAARTAVSRLVNEWDDALADDIAAGNLFLDRSKERWRRELAALRETHGTCRADERFDVENALRGQWTMQCDRGAVRVSITLAPTVPPRVQHLSVVPVTAPPTAQPGACRPQR
jgi:CubicO group peptidase (beta-lactamase class C family)